MPALDSLQNGVHWKNTRVVEITVRPSVGLIRLFGAASQGIDEVHGWALASCAGIDIAVFGLLRERMADNAAATAASQQPGPWAAPASAGAAPAAQAPADGHPGSFPSLAGNSGGTAPGAAPGTSGGGEQAWQRSAFGAASPGESLLLRTGAAQPPQHSLSVARGPLPAGGGGGGGAQAHGHVVAPAPPALWLLAAGTVSSTMAQLVSFPLGLVCTRLKVSAPCCTLPPPPPSPRLRVLTRRNPLHKHFWHQLEVFVANAVRHMENRLHSESNSAHEFVTCICTPA